MSGGTGLSARPTRSRLGGLHPPLHLRDSYKLTHKNTITMVMFQVCFARDGAVRSVVPDLPVLGINHGIVAKLQTWHFDPQPEPACESVQFVFDIGGQPSPSNFLFDAAIINYPLKHVGQSSP